MLNSAMCLPPTLNFFPSPRGTSWISDTFRNTATAHLLKRTLLASCTAELWPFQRLHTRVGPSWGGQVPYRVQFRAPAALRSKSVPPTPPRFAEVRGASLPPNRSESPPPLDCSPG